MFSSKDMVFSLRLLDLQENKILWQIIFLLILRQSLWWATKNEVKKWNSPRSMVVLKATDFKFTTITEIVVVLGS